MIKKLKVKVHHEEYYLCYENKRQKMHRLMRNKIWHENHLQKETAQQKQMRLTSLLQRKRKFKQKETSEHKQKRQKVDNERHKEKTQKETAQQKQLRQANNLQSQLKCRQKETAVDKQKRQKVDNERHKNKKETAQQKQRRQQNNLHSQQKHRERETLTEKQRKQRKDKEKHHESRHPTLIECATKNFVKEIQKSPEYSCTVCHRLMYKESTIELKISSYKNSDVPNACRTHLKTISDKEWICLTCHRHLKKGAIPPQAQVNNMSLPEETCILDDLTDFES